MTIILAIIELLYSTFSIYYHISSHLVSDFIILISCRRVQLEITEFIPTLLYFGYTTLMVFTFWLLTGAIGFYAAYFFIRKIYAAIKID